MIAFLLRCLRLFRPTCWWMPRQSTPPSVLYLHGIRWRDFLQRRWRRPLPRHWHSWWMCSSCGEST